MIRCECFWLTTTLVHLPRFQLSRTWRAEGLPASPKNEGGRQPEALAPYHPLWRNLHATTREGNCQLCQSGLRQGGTARLEPGLPPAPLTRPHSPIARTEETRSRSKGETNLWPPVAKPVVQSGILLAIQAEFATALPSLKLRWRCLRPRQRARQSPRPPLLLQFHR